ncbi:hypothetical protein FO519_010498, partial [Halicephalobus sp. NKZ332]
HLIKPNPFALALGDLLNELVENSEEYSLSVESQVRDAIHWTDSLQQPIMPTVKKSLYYVYRERLQNERNMIFPHVFGRIHQHQFNLLTQKMLERGKVVDQRYT